MSQAELDILAIIDKFYRVVVTCDDGGMERTLDEIRALPCTDELSK